MYPCDFSTSHAENRRSRLNRIPVHPLYHISRRHGRQRNGSFTVLLAYCYSRFTCSASMSHRPEAAIQPLPQNRPLFLFRRTAFPVSSLSFAGRTAAAAPFSPSVTDHDIRSCRDHSPSDQQDQKPVNSFHHTPVPPYLNENRSGFRPDTPEKIPPMQSHTAIPQRSELISCPAPA